MKNRATLFNANHLALMHGLRINPTTSRLSEAGQISLLPGQNI